MTRESDKALKEALAKTSKTFGKGIAMQLGEEKPLDCEVFSTGSVSVDFKAIGAGGFPRGLVTELYGPEGGGKSTMAMHGVANAQAEGHHALYMDVEHAFNPKYAAKCGVDIERLVISQPDYGEQALQIVENFLDARALGIVVVDSVAMLVPRAEIEGEIGDAGVGMLSRMMTQALRKLLGKIHKANVAMIFINQVRDKIGVTYGETTTTPGGHMLKHLASLRLDVRRISSLKINDRVVGARGRAKALKNRVGSPYQEAEFDLIFGEGISKEADLIDVAEEMSILSKDGTWYCLGEERLGHGREKTRLLIKENPELFSRIRQLVMEQARRKRDEESGSLSE